MQPRILICFLVFNLGFYVSVNSQIYKVKYHNFNDTVIPAEEEVTTLLLTTEASANWTVPYKYYSTATRIKTGEGRFIYKSNQPADTLKRFIYKNRSNRTMSFESRFPYVYNKMKVIQDTLDCIKWEVKSETRIIFNYKCVKAITFFRGRSYVAWFAPDIPLSDGPWKFNGLPGLIFEVYDTDKKFLWTLSSFEKVTEKFFIRVVHFKNQPWQAVEFPRAI